MKKGNKITKVFLALLMIFGLLVVDAGVYATERIEQKCTTSNGTIKLTKIDSSTQNRIEGVEFAFSKNKDKLTNYNGSDKDVITKTTNNKGVIEFSLPSGTWYYKEIKSTGYIVDTSIYEVKINQNKVSSITCKNTSYGKLKIIKENETGTQLNGAEFKLLFVENTVETVVVENFVVNGEKVFDNLIPGTYKLVETKAPQGYELSSTPITIEVEAYSKNKTIAIVTVKNYPTPPPSEGYLLIRKFDTGKHNRLKGAEFGVYTDAECKQAIVGSPFTTNENGETSTIKLALGTYYIKELKSPSGYILDPRIASVNITSNNTVTFEMENSETPPTAGNYANTLLLGLLLTAFTCITFGCYKFAKKHVSR